MLLEGFGDFLCFGRIPTIQIYFPKKIIIPVVKSGDHAKTSADIVCAAKQSALIEIQLVFCDGLYIVIGGRIAQQVRSNSDDCAYVFICTRKLVLPDVGSFYSLETIVNGRDRNDV
jgi:hypothetical protein